VGQKLKTLCIFSKIFENILEQQLSDFFENIFNAYLCAFRRGHGCPNMVKRLFADVIHDAIWFMNIHEQNHP
jgi:hypothetical protein